MLCNGRDIQQIEKELLFKDEQKLRDSHNSKCSKYFRRLSKVRFKKDKKDLWEVIKRIYKLFVGKSINEAFSYFIKNVDVNKAHYKVYSSFLDATYTRGSRFKIDEDGIIQENPYFLESIYKTCYANKEYTVSFPYYFFKPVIFNISPLKRKVLQCSTKRGFYIETQEIVISMDKQTYLYKHLNLEGFSEKFIRDISDNKYEELLKQETDFSVFHYLEQERKLTFVKTKTELLPTEIVLVKEEKPVKPLKIKNKYRGFKLKGEFEKKSLYELVPEKIKNKLGFESPTGNYVKVKKRKDYRLETKEEVYEKNKLWNDRRKKLENELTIERLGFDKKSFVKENEQK